MYILGKSSFSQNYISLSLLPPPLLSCPFPIMDPIAAANAAMKFGSAVTAAVAALMSSWLELWTPEHIVALFCWAANCPKTNGLLGIMILGFMFLENGNWNGACWRILWSELLGFVRSNVIVGNGAVDDKVVVRFGWQEESMDPCVRWWLRWLELEIEPESSIEAAAEVVEAIVIAACGSGWLWVPSYVVVKIERSSVHLCTYTRFGLCYF